MADTKDSVEVHWLYWR